MSAPVVTQFQAYVDAVTTLGRQPRAGQQELVARGTELLPLETLLVRAPTATGKSLAALLIAGFRWERNDENRTVIATYTKLLQDQYARSSADPELMTDLDQARQLFPGMRFAVLKGANNYLCRIAAKKITGGPFTELAEGSGDPGEVKDHPGHMIWKAKADSSRCGRHQPDECGFAAAKLRARQADCVITNHALVMVNGQNPAVLGQHSLLIVDEIHNLPRAADSFATTETDLGELIADLNKDGQFQAAEMVAGVMRRLGKGDPWSDRIPTVEELTNIGKLGDNLGLVEPIVQWWQAAVAFYKNKRVAKDYTATVGKAGRWDRDGGRVIKRSAVNIAPITAQGLATELIIPGSDSRPEVLFERAVLMMSATTGTPTKPTYVADRCGVKAELLDVESALNYPEQMQVSMLDLPTGWSYAQAVARLCTESGGRTLVLCRSWKMVNEINEHLMRQDVPFRVFVQDQERSSNNGGVVSQFKADTTSVLVGTASFFEGIDIPGESLSQVIITQLPMLMTMSPLEEARKRAMGSRFITDAQIPHTALILEQMMGRLIRSTSDRGMVAVLDPNAQHGWGHTASRYAVEAFGSPIVSRLDALAWFKAGV